MRRAGVNAAAGNAAGESAARGRAVKVRKPSERVVRGRAAKARKNDEVRGAGSRRNEDEKGRREDRTDYRTYVFSGKEVVELIGIYLVISGMIVWLFYNRLIVWAAAIPLFPVYLKLMRKRKAEARRRQMSFDFRGALNSLSVSLRAGRSVESAFYDASRELVELVGPESCITQEFIHIVQQVRVSVPIEVVLTNFARRSGIEDIENFAAVFSAAKRMGGDMAGILRSAAESIEGKLDVEREIEMTLAAKRMESRVMDVMPCGIILYMRLASPGFLDVMYETAVGALIMTVCLLLYAAAVFWCGKIADIRV